MHAESDNNNGLFYIYICQDDQTPEDFNKEIELDQNIAITYHNRGNLYLKTGYKRLAILYFQRASD
jgi:tetratricopeptide (TPR) repeat protein